MTKRTRAIFLLGLVVCTASSALAGTPVRRETNRVAVAKALLRAIYPQLTTRWLTLEVHDYDGLVSDTTLSEFAIVLKTPPPFDYECNCGPPPGGGQWPKPDPPATVLKAYFAFTVGDSTPWVFRSSSLIDSDKSIDLGRAIRKLREQQRHSLVIGHDIEGFERDLAAAQKKHDAEYQRLFQDFGAHFGPGADRELLKQLPIKNIEKVLGPIRVLRTELDTHIAGMPPRWIVQFEVARESSKRRYCLYADPLEGIITEISGDGPEPLFRGSRRTVNEQ